MNKKYISIEQAFKLGQQAFKDGKPEYDFPDGLTELGKKEFVRGWTTAYFKNLHDTQTHEYTKSNSFPSPKI